jgi:hypothetical protein
MAAASVLLVAAPAGRVAAALAREAVVVGAAEAGVAGAVVEEVEEVEAPTRPVAGVALSTASLRLSATGGARNLHTRGRWP